MSPLMLLVVILLILVICGGLPSWGIHHYGYGPSSIGFVVLIVLLILLLTGKL